MLPLEHPNGIQIAFDDHRLVANAGLLLPATLALRLGLGELVDQHVNLGDALGRANIGDKMLTLVASALAGGDCIADADALRSGSTGQALGCVVKAPSTLGASPRGAGFSYQTLLAKSQLPVQLPVWLWSGSSEGLGDGVFVAFL